MSGDRIPSGRLFLLAGTVEDCCDHPGLLDRPEPTELRHVEALWEALKAAAV